MNWPLLQNSLLVAGTTTALAVGFGLIVALWLATLTARWRNVFLALAIVALALPPFLVTNCWLDLLGQSGVWQPWLPLNIFSLGGSVWILSLLLWPITSLLVLSGWRRLEAAQLECDPALSGFALLRVLLVPMASGELALAAVVTFVLALNNFAVPVILQTHVLPEEMWIRFSTAFDAVGALKAGLPMVVAPMVLLALFWRRKNSWPRLQGAVAARIFCRQLGLAWRTGCGVIATMLCALSVGLPLAQISLAKRTWLELPGAVEAGTNAAWNSFWFAAVAATVVVAAALALGIRSSRRDEVLTDSQSRIANRRGGIMSLLTSSPTMVLLWLPFFIPGVLLGIALIHLFNRPPFLDFYRSAGIVVLAFVVRYFALGMSGARHAIQSTDPDLTDAARLEGATRWQMLRHVLWPQIAPQVLAAWYVVYLLCLWDVESMVLVYPPGGETLALRIFNLLHYGYAGQVNALCLALLGLAVLPLAVWLVWYRARRACCVLRVAWMPACVAVLFSGCLPSDESHGNRIESRFFERAEVIGSRGVGVGEFNKTRSVAVDLQDNVYAVDMTGRVQKFSPDGTFLLSWQMPETTLGKAKGMGCDREGNIIVIEPHYQRVNHYAPDGKLVAQWGRRGTNAGEFMLPRAVAVNSQGEYLVSEYTAMERVQRFAVKDEGRRMNDESGEIGSNARPHPGPLPQEREKRRQSVGVSDTNLIRADLEIGAPMLLGVIGKAGIGPGEFNRPEGICVDGQDRLYVADSCNHRIQIFSSDGKFIRQYGRAGSGLGELSYPYDIAVDTQGNQFVCEFGNSRIQVFDANDQPIEIIGGPGAEVGRFANPWAVALDSHGNLYVADSQNHRVQKLVRRMGQMGRMSATHASR